jgi:hypothetical protein
VKTLVNEKVLHLLRYHTDMIIDNDIITDNVASKLAGVK